MADTRDITGKNRKFTGTDSVRLPVGTTGERVASGSADKGKIRFNSTTNLSEYYTGTEWKSIDSPPTITNFTIDGGSSVTAGGVDRTTAGNFTLVIAGSLYDTTGATVTLVPENGGATVNVQSITRDSATQLTAVFQRSDLNDSNDPYTLKVTNGSGLSAELSTAITVNKAPTFATNADTNVLSTFGGASSPFSETTIAATDADGDSVTHTISAGSLPTGLSLSAAGALTGTVAGGATLGDYTFTVQAADGFYQVTRQFVLSVAQGPVDAEYTSSGTFTYTVPTGVNNISVVCIGAGGASGIGNSGQGGGGGALAYRNAISVTPGQTATVVVGAANGRSGNNGQAGGSSSFTYSGTTTTAGGGGGGGGTGTQSGGSAGSGGTRSGTNNGGGDGGSGGQDGQNAGGPGGGGAGGYSGNGGNAVGGYSPTTAANGNAGTGGGGGGGGKGGANEGGGGGGGGTGLFGEGTNGAGGTGQGQNANEGGGGGGGSGGASGSDGSTQGEGGFGGSGGAGGGGQGGPNINSGANGNGGVGSVRIVYHPSGAAFPSTNVGDV